MTKVAILGAGYMGTATAWPLSDNGHEVRLVGTHLDNEIIEQCKSDRFHPRLKRTLPEGVTPYYLEELEIALDGVGFIVSGVNSMGVRWSGQVLGPYLEPGQSIISVTKGIESGRDGNFKILPDVLRDELPESIRSQVAFAAIGGPCIANELAGRRQSCVYFGSRDLRAARYLADAFRTPYYHVWVTDDLEGLEITVAMKNAYATGVGMAYGILQRQGGLDEAEASVHNLAAALFAQGCIEMQRMLAVMGATTDFAYDLAGAGDFFVTTLAGRSMQLGRLLGEGRSYPEAVRMMEGETMEAALMVQQMARVLPALEQKGRLASSEMPFMQMLVDIIVNGQPITFLLDRFFRDCCI